MQMKRFVISFSTSFWTNIIMLSMEITEMNYCFLLSVACTLKLIYRLNKDTLGSQCSEDTVKSTASAQYFKTKPCLKCQSYLYIVQTTQYSILLAERTNKGTAYNSTACHIVFYQFSFTRRMTYKYPKLSKQLLQLRKNGTKTKF